MPTRPPPESVLVDPPPPCAARGGGRQQRKRRRGTCPEYSLQWARRHLSAVVVLVCALLLQSKQGFCRGQEGVSVSASWGTSFVVARLDHTDRAYCQGRMLVVLVNPDPTRPAEVRIEAAIGSGSQAARQLTVPPSDQLTYGDFDCNSLLDADRDEVPDARQWDRTTPENVTRILPRSAGFAIRIRSTIPIRAYAASLRGSLSDGGESGSGGGPRDLSLLLPEEALGSTYRLLDFAMERRAGDDEATSVAISENDDDDDDDNDNDDSYPQRRNRTRYTTFGIVALGTGDASTSVYLQNDVTRQQSTTYELQDGEVLWYRSRTIVTTAAAEAQPAASSSNSAASATTPRKDGPSQSDGYYRIRPRPPWGVVDDDDDDNSNDGFPVNEQGGHPNSNNSTSGLYDITGWHVVASRPVAVFVGSYGELEPSGAIDGGSTGSGGPAGDRRPAVRFRSYQQLVPEAALGSTYMVCPVEAAPVQQGGNVTCDSDRDGRFVAACQDPANRVRYIATRSGTTVTLVFPGSYEDEDDSAADATTASSTQHIYLEKAGQYYDLTTTRPHHAMSNFPLYVYQSLDGLDNGGDLRSLSMMLVPSMDQLLRPQASSPASAAAGPDSSSPPPIRVAVQRGSSSLRLLHAKSDRIALNDEWVVNANSESGGSSDDRIEDDLLYRTIRQHRRKRPCRTVGSWLGVEYCCTQIDQVPAGMFTITAAPSSSEAAEPRPIGISVVSPVDKDNGIEAASQASSKGTFLAKFFNPDPTETPNPGEGGRTTDSGTRNEGGSPPVPPVHNSSEATNGTGFVAAAPSRRVFGYSGGMGLRETSARCSTGGPYTKRVFRLPSPNFPLAGEATCRDESLTPRVTWSSSSSIDVVFSIPTRADTKARFQQPGLFTLCMAVSCDGEESVGASCCGTFEIIQDSCDAGGPYRVEVNEDDLPASIKLEGAVDSCEDGTTPEVTWFHNATDDDPLKNHVEFADPDRLDGRVLLSSFGAYELCMRTKCGKSELLWNECCARTRVRQLPSEAGGAQDGPPSRPEAPSEVIQQSPTSTTSSAGRPSRQPLSPAAPRDSEGRRPTESTSPSSSPFRSNLGSTDDGSSRDDAPNQPTYPPRQGHLGLASKPRIPSPPSPPAAAPSLNGVRQRDPSEENGSGSPRDDSARTNNAGGGGGDRGGRDGQNEGDGGGSSRGKDGGGRQEDQDPILPRRTPLNIFFRGG